MTCQILFSRKNKKNISECRLLKFYPECKVLNECFAVQGRIIYSFSNWTAKALIRLRGILAAWAHIGYAG